MDDGGEERSLLVLGMAHAMLGDAEKATGAGISAFDTARVVWPTIVLAKKLERTVARTGGGSSAARLLRGRIAEAESELKGVP